VIFFVYFIILILLSVIRLLIIEPNCLMTEAEKYTQEITTEGVDEVQDLYPAIDPPTTKWSRMKTKLTTRDGWIGDYDYRALW
jgi:hypothetical protein